MSETNLARRASYEVFFSGVDITSSVEKYLLSLTYTDNEEDATDDLQIKLQDKDSIWLERWLNTAIEAAADREPEEIEKKYKAISKSGVSVLSGKEPKSKTIGTLAYGTVIKVKEIEEGWARFEYSDKTGYVKEMYLQPIYTEVGYNITTPVSTVTTSSASNTSSSDWKIGDEVKATGKPQYSSYGTGRQGTSVTNYEGSITYLNLKKGVPYPIHVGSLGWFAENQVSKIGSDNINTTQTVGEVSKGLKIQASITRQNWMGDKKIEKMECGQFELDNVSAQGPPSIIIIKGTSLPYSSTIRQTKKSKSWENYTLSGIANEIAKTNGMASLFLCDKDTSYSRVEQYMITDIGFLQKLCQDAGCSLKSTNNMIVIFDQASYERKQSIKTILHGPDGGYTQYKLSSGENDIYTSCRVSYVDSDGKLITATAYIADYDKDSKKNQCLEIKQKVANYAEALALATKKLRLHNKFEFTASFTFPGEPDLLAGCVVTLSGWGAWDGRYIIKQAKHTVSNTGYTTQITLRRALNFDTNQNENTNTASQKSIDEVAREVIRGSWGNGEERKRKLTEAGYDYAAVQARVNQLLH